MSAAPLRIGYCLSLTGPVAGNTRSAQLAHQIWCEDVNRAGGLLGRPVELVCYDDEGRADRTSSLYAKLIDQDRVDLVLGGYGTNTLLAALPVVSRHGRYFVGLMGLGVNRGLDYPKYFAMIPTGPDPNAALTEGFFALAAEQSPRPRRVALLSADAEFARNPILGAKANAATYGFEVVFEQTYPLSTEDFSPILDAIAATDAELLFVCSYLKDSADFIRSLRRHVWRPKMVGASMIGPQNTEVKTALGPLLNGVVNYEYWAPSPSLMFDGAAEVLTIYQSRAADAGVDLLGHYTALLAYAQMQVVAQAVGETGSLDDETLTAHTRDATFQTVMGDVQFGTGGEWSRPRVLQVQFQDIEGEGVEQFRNGSRQAVVWPPELASGALRYPYV
ncbi:amino acid ABC transporter substrate-binding protein [Brevundimonas sp.]|jgi:branched-chain amino acid transport system substrate-binding protein|uniref:amino acid ABC transporter substrate-binding protein n=1 Tax=Brevundimonas sp. TaxID=1871086 RepID=UPI0037BE5272